MLVGQGFNINNGDEALFIYCNCKLELLKCIYLHKCNMFYLEYGKLRYIEMYILDHVFLQLYYRFIIFSTNLSFSIIVDFYIGGAI